MNSFPGKTGALLVVAAGALLAILESPFEPVVWQHVSAALKELRRVSYLFQLSDEISKQL